MTQPIEKYVAGQVSAALWENEITTNSGTTMVLKATVQRRYQAKNGEWKSTTSFGRNEIPLAIHCLQKAFEKMVEPNGEKPVEEIVM